MKAHSQTHKRDMDTKRKEKLSYAKWGRSKHERALSPSPAMMTKKKGHAQNAMNGRQNCTHLILQIDGCCIAREGEGIEGCSPVLFCDGDGDGNGSGNVDVDWGCAFD